MKLQELKEDQSRDDEILARAKNDFVNKLVTNLGTAVDSAYGSQPTQQVPTQPAAPETPEQKRIRLQKAAQQNIDKTAAPFSRLPNKPAVWRHGRNPSGKAFAIENTQYARLNKIFESLMYADEATNDPAESASTLIISNFIKQMNAPRIFNINDPAILSTLNQFADEIENTYSQDKGRSAIKRMGEWAWDTMSEFKQNQRSSRLGTGSTNNPAQPSPANTSSGPSINADGSITISGAKGQAPSKVMPGDPLYKQLVATINRQINNK